MCKCKALILPREHLRKHRKGRRGLGGKVISFKVKHVTVRGLCPRGLGNSVPQPFSAIQEIQRE